MLSPTVGSSGVAVSYERGTPVGVWLVAIGRYPLTLPHMPFDFGLESAKTVCTQGESCPLPVIPSKVVGIGAVDAPLEVRFQTPQECGGFGIGRHPPRFRRRNNLEGCRDFYQNLALADTHVPCSLDSGHAPPAQLFV